MEIHERHIKSYLLTIIFAVLVLVAVVSLINVSADQIVGRAAYRQIQIYGEIAPNLPDGTELSFKIDRMEVAYTEIKNNSYGFDPKVFLKMDDPSTPEIEGYRQGDTVKIYIQGVEVGELSYFKLFVTKKDIEIPASKRIEVTNAAVNAAVKRDCIPVWQCEDWGECAAGSQTRRCMDMNDCGTEDRKPVTSRICAAAPVQVPAAAAEKEETNIAGIVLLALFVIFIIAFFISLIKRAKQLEKKAKKEQNK